MVGLETTGSRKSQVPKPSGHCILQKTTHFNTKTTTKLGCTHQKKCRSRPKNIFSPFMIYWAESSTNFRLFTSRNISMATSNSFTFQADKDTLFATTVQIIREAGYAISETDNTGKKIIYCVDRKGSFGGRYEATITVSGAENSATAVLGMKVAGLHNPATGSSASYRKFEVDLISFVVNKLSERFQTVTASTKIAYKANKRGKGGWLILLGIIGLLVAVYAFGGLKFLKTFLPWF